MIAPEPAGAATSWRPRPRPTRQPGRGRQERRERAGRHERRQQLAAEPADQPCRQLEHHGVGASGGDQVGRVEPAERAVDRRQQVEGAEQRQHHQRRAPGGPAVGVGVEAHEHVRQAHRAEERGQDQRVRAVERVRARRRERCRPHVARRPARGHALGGRRDAAVAEPDQQQEQHRHGSAVSLSQYWNACTKVMLRMPPDSTLTSTTTRDQQPAHPGRRAGDRAAASGRHPGTAASGTASRSRRPAATRPAHRRRPSRASAKSGSV